MQGHVFKILVIASVAICGFAEAQFYSIGDPSCGEQVQWPMHAPCGQPVDGFMAAPPINTPYQQDLCGQVIVSDPPCHSEVPACHAAPQFAIADQPLLADFAGFYGGFEFLWLRASFDQNVAMIIDPPVGNRMVPFNYDLQFSPRAWLGWQSCCGAGFRASYFRYDDSSDTEQATAVAGATPVYTFVYGAGGNLSRNAYADLGETLVANHSLTIQTLDLEATQTFCWQSVRGLIGLGVRIADIDQQSLVNGYDATFALEEAVGNHLTFTGAGPTTSIMLTLRIAASRFSIFADTRGSLLLGDTEQRIYEMKNAGVDELTDIAFQHELIGNAEMQIGVQFGQSIGQCAGAFVRAGYVGQLWLDVGGPVDSTSSLTLDGITFAAGVNF